MENSRTITHNLFRKVCPIIIHAYNKETKHVPIKYSGHYWTCHTSVDWPCHTLNTFNLGVEPRMLVLAAQALYF